MIKPRAIDHLVLRTSRVDQMIEFYCDVLGCTVERQVEEFGLVQLRAGGSLIDLVDVDGKLGREGGGAPGKEGRNLDHFCLRIEPFDEMQIRKVLRDNGVFASETEIRYGAEGNGPSIYARDPDDNTVELKGPPTSID